MCARERESCDSRFILAHFFLLFAIVVVASSASPACVVVVIFCTLPQNSLMIKNVYILRTAQAAGHR